MPLLGIIRVAGFPRDYPTLGALRRSFLGGGSMAADPKRPRVEPPPKVVILAGPTASGKSDVAAQLCATWRGLIVSADSVQAYRGVHIGANKPTADERVATPHLLIDVADAATNYNSATWRRDALYCIRALTQTPWLEDDPDRDDDDDDDATVARHRLVDADLVKARTTKGYAPNEPVLPVVVGGTMMYLQWLVHGRPDALRPTERALATALDLVTDYQDRQDWEGAVAKACQFGPKFAQQVSKLCGRDWYRLRRILEIALTVQEKGNDDESLLEGLYSGQREDKLASLGYDVRCFFLCPTDRMVHAKVVDERCEQMIQRGLLQETTDLAVASQLPDMAAKAIGYRQTLDYLESRDVQDNDKDAFISYLEEFTTATRRYSKRQMQWFRRDKDFCFVPISFNETKQERVEAAAAEIGRLLAMSREDYDRERVKPESVSETTRNDNEAQGKTMKTYQFARKILVDDSEALMDVLEQADECRYRFYGINNPPTLFLNTKEKQASSHPVSLPCLSASSEQLSAS